MAGKLLLSYLLFLLITSVSFSQLLQNFSSKYSNNSILSDVDSVNSEKNSYSFKPGRLLSEIGVGVAASAVGTIFGGFLGGRIAAISGENGPWGGFAHVILGGYIGYCIGSAGGVYLVSKRFNDEIKFYEPMLVSLTTGALSLFTLSRTNGKSGWTLLLLPLPVTILYSQLFYPSKIQIKAEQQIIHGHAHSNLTLAIPFNLYMSE